MKKNCNQQLAPNHLMKYVKAIKNRPLVPYYSKYVEFITCNAKRNFIVGTISSDNFKDHSNLWLINAEDSLILEKPTTVTNMHLLKQLTTCRFLNDHENKFLFATEQGEVSLVELNEITNVNRKYLAMLLVHTEIKHLQTILKIVQWKNCKYFATVSSDSLKFWTSDFQNDFCLQHSFSLTNDYYEITSADSHKFDTNLLAMTTTERSCYLYDIRQEKNVSCLYEHEFSILLHCSFHTIDENKLLFGLSTGDIYSMDIRRPNEFLTKVSTESDYNEVSIMDMNDKGYLAVGTEKHDVIVYDTNGDNFNSVYRKTNNTELRDFCWVDSVLYSCHWNSPIYKHIF